MDIEVLTGQLIELSVGQGEEKTFSLSVIEIYFIHNISALIIVFTT